MPMAMMEFTMPAPNTAVIMMAERMAGKAKVKSASRMISSSTQPPQPSWGRMLSEAQTLMFQAPLLAVWPGMAIALAVLGLNLLGDGLRDLLDPRLSRKR